MDLGQGWFCASRTTHQTFSCSRPTCHSIHRIDREKSLREVLRFLAELAPVQSREGDSLDLDFCERRVAALQGQWIVSREQKVGDHAERPHVAAFVVANALVVLHIDLGSDVVASSHQTMHVVRIVDDPAQSKVNQFDLRVWTIVRKHDIRQSILEHTNESTLQIAMRNVLGLVEIGNGVYDGFDDSLCVPFRKFPHYSSSPFSNATGTVHKTRVELTTAQQLLDQINGLWSFVYFV